MNEDPIKRTARRPGRARVAVALTARVARAIAIQVGKGLWIVLKFLGFFAWAMAFRPAPGEGRARRPADRHDSYWPSQMYYDKNYDYID